MDTFVWSDSHVVNPELMLVAQHVADLLKSLQVKIAFAESCTAGLLSLTLSQFPGISSHLCGSAVTYRNQTKAAWLKLDLEALEDPKAGPVSAIVADAMCCEVLRITPEADIAVSITGHLGPDAPLQLDGVAYCGFARRSHAPGEPESVTVRRFELPCEADSLLDLRHRRQLSAAAYAFEFMAEQMSSLRHG